MKGVSKMEKLEKVYGLMDELMDAVKEQFPDMSTVGIELDRDGYRAIDVVEWAADVKRNADTQYKYLLVQCRIDGKWTDDWSERQNKYLADQGLLLEVG